MWLDTLFKGQLLVGANTKLQIAAEEGVKIKKLVGAVRSLWRSSPAGNHPRVTQLKGLLRPSPSRSRVACLRMKGSGVIVCCWWVLFHFIRACKLMVPV